MATVSQLSNDVTARDYDVDYDAEFEHYFIKRIT